MEDYDTIYNGTCQISSDPIEFWNGVEQTTNSSYEHRDIRIASSESNYHQR